MRFRKVTQKGEQVLKTLLFAALVAVLAILPIGPALATDAARFQAETMTYNQSSTYAAVISDKAASGGKALKWNKQTSGKASKTMTTSASDKIVIRAKATAANGAYPEMAVYVDGTKVSATRTLSGSYADYTTTTNLSAGSHKIEVEGVYMNGRSLTVDVLTLPETAPPPPPPDSDGDGVPDASDACPNDPATNDADGDGCEDTTSDCSTPLQEQINAATAGDTINGEGCTFREAVTVPKALTIDLGTDGAIKGSDDWSADFTASGSNYRSSKTVPALTQSNPDNCIDGTTECAMVEQVFVDGVEQKQLANGADPAAGQFSLDASRRVVLGANPGSAKVEVTTRPSVLTVQADDVQIKGGTIEHSANRAQQGMVSNADNEGFYVEGAKIQHAHGPGVFATDAGGPHSVKTTEIVSSKINHNGQLGVGASKGWVEIRGPGCELNHNGHGGFDPAWEAGGAKFAGILRSGTFHKATVDGCEVGHNIKGVWSDTDAQNISYLNNRVHDNDRFGLQLEITNNALVSGNVAYDNGYGDTRQYGWGAQIASTSSRNVEIRDNVTAWGPDGIVVMSANRCAINSLTCDSTSSDYRDMSNIRVHHNTILHTDRDKQPFGLGWMHDWNSNLFDPDSGNGGYDNKYWYPLAEGASGAGQRFAWGGTIYKNLSAFNATLGEENGRYLTTAEKDAVLNTHNLPSSPGG